MPVIKGLQALRLHQPVDIQIVSYLMTLFEMQSYVMTQGEM
jgi:hypothetical protein